MGLGLAAVRDFVTYAFLYQGFNADEEGRQVFDGVMAHVAGAGRGSFSHRFAQPSRDGQQMDAVSYPTDLYPFTDAPTTDTETRRTEGLLDRVVELGVAPKLFQTNTSYEYWGRASSLIHTTPDGRRDAVVPAGVRLYHLAGLQHFSRSLPPRQMSIPHIRGVHPINPNPSSYTLRALVVAMQRWIRGEGEPPPSAYPRLDAGTLVKLEYLWEQKVCGHVIDRLMGGSPEAHPERYAIASPATTVPAGVPQVLVNGARDFWTTTAMRYFEAAESAGADVRIVEAAESGHFEMIDPGSSSWPLARDAALELLRAFPGED